VLASKMAAASRPGIRRESKRGDSRVGWSETKGFGRRLVTP
jgi:hypothetical protein